MRNVLLKAGVRKDVGEHVMEGLIQTSLRGVDSHGVRLLPHYLAGIKGGRINANPDYKFKRTSLSTGTLDADHTFGHAACMEAAKHAISMAREAGVGNVAVYNSTHFGAAAFYALEIARNDMIGIALTNTDALVKCSNGKSPFFGNNPICVAVPCDSEEPFCLDMATSVVTFNKIRQLREEGVQAPAGVGANSAGVETTDPSQISMLLPIGDYKGYGLSMVVEIFCSLLTGMPYGPHIPKMFDAPMDQKRFLGQFISAVRIDCFQDKENFKKRMSSMMKEVRKCEPANKDVCVQVAGDPEKRTAAIRKDAGIPLKQAEHKEFVKIENGYGERLL
jgi:ureidoglycolate dehydrogenase (NAD+)